MQRVVTAALDKKAFDLDVLDVSKLTTLGDYFIICSGNTERQTQAIADAIEQKLLEFDHTKPKLVEGTGSGRWILLDYADFVVHIFTDECRRFYSLERLWGDAPNVTEHFTEAPAAATAAAHGRKK